MVERTRSVAAQDGRTLSFAQWGDLDGAPVLYLHGTPGSRLSRPPDESKVRAAGIHLITYDRPGYGGSDRSAGRRVLDCVTDVQAIMDALGVASFAVTGSSGGGPHALALAARLPERVTSAECVVGAAPFDAEGLDWTAGMDEENVAEFGWAGQGEEVLHREVARLAAADLERLDCDPALIFSDDWNLPDADRRVLGLLDVQLTMAASMREAYRAGVWGWVDDDLAFVWPWGFEVGEIRVPVTIRYGRDDVLVPASHGAWLAAHLPDAQVVVEDGAGHFSTPETTLDRLVALSSAPQRVTEPRP